MMLVDGSGSASLVVWSETIAVVPNTTYDFSAWAASTYPLIPSVLGFEANGVQLGSDLNLPATTGQWQQFTASWNSGSNTSLTLAIFDRNTVTTRPGNDFALDDLSLTTSVFAVPEPSSLLLMLTGGGAFGFVRRGRGRCGSPAADGVAGRRRGRG